MIWFTAKTLKGRYKEYCKYEKENGYKVKSYLEWLEHIASEYFWS